MDKHTMSLRQSAVTSMNDAFNKDIYIYIKHTFKNQRIPRNQHEPTQKYPNKKKAASVFFVAQPPKLCSRFFGPRKMLSEMT